MRPVTSVSVDERGNRKGGGVMEYQSHRFDYDPETEIFTCFFCGMKCDINDAKSIIEAHYSSIRNCSEPAEKIEPPEVE